MSILELRGVSKAFGGVQAVLDVTLTVQEGELGAIIGPNGAGKSTLFNLITGHYKLDQGQVLFPGLDQSLFYAAVRRQHRDGGEKTVFGVGHLHSSVSLILL